MLKKKNELKKQNAVRQVEASKNDSVEVIET